MGGNFGTLSCAAHWLPGASRPTPLALRDSSGLIGGLAVQHWNSRQASRNHRMTCHGVRMEVLQLAASMNRWV
jgi:hypothetical protein